MEILTLGSKIKNRRKEIGLTLKELAGERVTPAQLSYVETDKCKPSLDLLEYIAEKLGLEMDYLLESEKKQVSRFCEYNIKCCRIEILKQNYDIAKNRVYQVKHASQAYQLDYYMGESEKYLGLICQYQNDIEESINHYLNALQKFSIVDSNRSISEIYLQLGLAEYRRNYFSASAAYFRQAERFVEKLDDIEIYLKISVYYNLMKYCDKLDNNERALYYSDKVSNYLKFITNINVYGEGLLSKGKFFEHQDKYNEALDFINKSLYVFESTNNIELISAVETDLGRILSDNTKNEESLSHLFKARDIKKLTGDTTLPLTLIEIAQKYIDRKDYDSAFEVINEALNTSIKSSNREYEAFSYYKLFKAFNKKGDYIKAEESIRRYAEILESIDKKKVLADCYLEMSEFYKSINREREAIEYVLMSMDIYKNLFPVKAISL